MNSWILEAGQYLATEETAQAASDFSPVYANIVATVALLLAGLSLLWQYRSGRLERPDVSISGQCAVILDGSDPLNPKWQFDVRLANTGHKTASVKEVAWQIETPAKSLMLVSDGQLIPVVPMKLEGLDTASWSMQIPIHGTRWKGLRGRPFAKVVRRLNWIEKIRKLEVERTLVGDWYQLEYDPELDRLPVE